MQGPDDAIVEYAGNHPAERFNHVHMFQEDPFCAQLWYQKHLNAPVVRGAHQPHAADRGQLQGAARARSHLAGARTGRACSARRRPRSSSATWRCPGTCARATQPLASTRGHVYDHIALSVADLDAWVAKLRGEGVTFLEEPYELGDTRAVMIEGPSREALELVEVR